MSHPNRRRILYLFWILLFVLHNDIWLWHDSRIVLGLPVGLLYHVGFCVAAAVMMGLLVTCARPGHLTAAAADPVPGEEEVVR